MEKLAGITGIFCNLLLFAGKLVVGTLCKSVSITADAVNNLSDASSSVVTLLGFKFAGKPADPEHPYGHNRMEYLSGLCVAVMILLIGAELVKTSVARDCLAGACGIFTRNCAGAGGLHSAQALDGGL